MATKIAKNWKELSGANDWQGILDPPTIDLRNYIISYGELAEATYDAFNDQEASKYCGMSRYAKKDFFTQVCLDPSKYQVSKFIYATAGINLPFIIKSTNPNAWSTESNWIGYVAVATDEGKTAVGRRDIVIAWRGTLRTLEWINDLQIFPSSASEIVGDKYHPYVHSGFLSVYTSSKPNSKYSSTSARDQVLDEVRRLVDLYKDEEISITVTGHSLGAALATLNAADIVANGYNKPTNQPDKACMVTAIVFACPRVGNDGFKESVEQLLNIHILRITNDKDVVPKVPFRFTEVGENLPINTVESPYLKDADFFNPLHAAGMWHNLEAYLHAVAGTQGSKGGFSLVVKRSYSLVNKHEDAVKDELCIPTNWWIERNKGMVKLADGSWVFVDREPDDDDDDDLKDLIPL